MNRKNLLKLAEYLLRPKLKAAFDMDSYYDHGSALPLDTNCGTAGCAAGHGPYAGIPKRKNEHWDRYVSRVFLEDTCSTEEGNEAFSWCFSSGWSEFDNTPEGAAKRILWMITDHEPGNVFADHPYSPEFYAATIEQLLEEARTCALGWT